jgi:hypothetical protein
MNLARRKLESTAIWRGVRARGGRLGPLLPVLVVLLAAAPPEVVRVHVPASQVTTWFPAGTPLRIMAVNEFELLREAATGGLRTHREETLPRLVRAHHRLRWNSGRLAGHSELVAVVPGSGPAALELDPWTPMVLPREQPAARIGALPSGRAVVWIETAPPRASPVTVPLDWELRSRPDSDGRRFVLGLPGDDTTILTLELPAGWAPLGPAGHCQGPLPGPRPEVRLWRFHGRPGVINLQLQDERALQGARESSAIWVSGPTRISTGTQAGTGETSALANWTTDWQVQADPGGQRQFRAVLDPGLELLEVTGPDLKEFRVERAGPATRVTVVLTGESLTRSTVRFAAHARVPLAGTWSVPAIRPEDAVWTGGTTTIVLDPSREIENCHDRAGLRIPPHDGDGTTEHVVVFEASSPASVADLVLRQPRPDATCLVRGRLLVDRAAPEAECELIGLSPRGTAVELHLELPSTWIIERLHRSGRDESLAWHQSSRASGGTLVTLTLPASEGVSESQTQTLILHARSTGAGDRGLWPLPRVRPLDCEVADETWVALADGTTVLTPIRGHGLAWVDLAQVEGALSSLSRRSPDLHSILSWRWTSADGEALVRREQARQEPRAEVQYRARIDEAGRRLSIQGAILVRCGSQPLGQVAVWIGQEPGARDAWSFQSERGGRELTKRALAAADRPALGFPGSGLAFALPVEFSGSTEHVLPFQAELPWSGSGSIPLIWLPRPFFPRGSMFVEVPQAMRSRVETAGLRRMDTALPERQAARWTPAAAGDGQGPGRALPPTHLVADAFTYTEPGGKLMLQTERMTRVTEPGVIRDACLTTLLYPGGPWPSRLRLLLRGDHVPQLAFSLPDGAELVRVQVDGTNASPTTKLGKIMISLPETTSGRTYQAIDIDFTVPGRSLSPGETIEPAAPSVDLPCLSFCWELMTPPSWAATDPGGGLAASEPPPRASWPFGALGFPEQPWPGRGPAPHVLAEETLHRLDAALASTRGDELTFAEWFTRWDAGAAPLVIDRLALGTAGHGPRTRCIPLRVDSRGESIASRTLQQYGLTLVPLETALVVTSQNEVPGGEEPMSWRPQIGEALLWGSDRSDRFQTVAHWRGEVTWKDAGRGESAESLRPLPAWLTWRFTSVQWPPREARVVMSNQQASLVLGWIVALLGTLLLTWAWRPTFRRGLEVPLALLSTAVLLRLWLDEQFAAVTAGLFVAAASSLLLRIGSHLTAPVRRSPRRLRGREGSSPQLLRGLRGTVIPLVILVIAYQPAVARRAADPVIPVLIPYEGSYDPRRPIDRVVLRQSDYDHLRGLAQAHAPAPSPQVILSEAIHRINWIDDRNVALESDLVLRASGQGAGSWSVPLADAREITATLGGRPVPVIIEAEGRRATIVLPGPGSFALRLRRTAAVSRDGPAEVIGFPVNVMPAARLEMHSPPRSRPPALINARGSSSSQPDGSISADLGPVDRVEVRWDQSAARPARPSAATLDLLALWDVEPAGDLVRARFTYRGAGGRSTLSFRMEAGLRARSVSVPGLVASAWENVDGQAVWTGRVDPPIEDGSVIELELWRPLPPRPERADGGAGEPRPVANDDSARRFPFLAPVGIAQGTGLLGIRRPGDWTGRLEPIDGLEPLSDESFVRTWGTLPDARLTLAGTTRLRAADLPRFRTGPAPSRIKVKPTLQLRIESGRMNIEYEAELSDVDATLHGLEAAIPENLVVLSARSEGLTAWSRPSPERLILRFDRPYFRPKRRLLISGWIPVAGEPLAVRPQTQQVTTPWIDLPGMDELPGTLVVTSISRVEPMAATGMALVTTAPAAREAGGDSRIAATFRVDDHRKLGALRWGTVPPRVNVLIESQLTIHPDSAEWVAVLRYSVQGGAIESIHLKLPTAWTFKAQRDLGGSDYHIRSDPLGPVTFWKISPTRPIWGSQRLVIRSALPLVPGQEVQHPEITPLGRGTSDTYLGLVYASDSAVSTAGSSGLRSITYASRFQDQEFGHSEGTEPRAYHVEHDNWSLKVQVPAGAEDARASQESARVVSADLHLTVLPDRSVHGRALYETQARTGRFLVAELPRGSSLLWATVDQGPVVPLRASNERWFVPLDNQGAARVALFWTGPLDVSDEGGESAWALDLPRAGPVRSSAIVRVHLPETLSAGQPPGGMELTGPDRVDLERADRIVRQVSEFIAQMDRGSGRDRERVASLLIAHEMELRSAERSLRWNARGGDRGRRERAQRDLEVIRSTRKALAETLRAAALDEELEAAENYLGQSASSASATTIAVPEPASPDRMRNQGSPVFLLGVAAGLNDPMTNLRGSFVRQTGRESETPEHARSMLMLGLLVALALVGARSTRPGRSLYLILAGILTLLGLLGGPVVLLTSLVILAAGRLTRPANVSELAEDRPPPRGPAPQVA